MTHMSTRPASRSVLGCKNDMSYEYFTCQLLRTPPEVAWRAVDAGFWLRACYLPKANRPTQEPMPHRLYWDRSGDETIGSQ